MGGRKRKLSEREREVMGLLLAGMTHAEMAAHLQISVHTVRSHITSVFNVTGCRQREALAAWIEKHPGVLPDAMHRPAKAEQFASKRRRAQT